MARRESLIATFCFSLILTATNLCLDSPPLWGDEADTGNFSRSVLVHGVPKAVLGDDLLVYGDCLQLGGGAKLLSRRLPWVQYYLGAASLTLFGDDTAGLRRLFALCGALAFFPLWLLLRTRTRAAPWLVTFVLLQPQALLFARQARYYPILLLLFALFAYLVVCNSTKGWRTTVAHCAVAALLFHTHPIAAAGACFAVCLYTAIAMRERLRTLCLASLFGGATWTVWVLCLPAITRDETSRLALAWNFPLPWAASVARDIATSFVDLDFVGVFPLLAWLLVAAVWVIFRKRLSRSAQAPRVGLLIVIALLVQITLNAVFVGSETPAHFSLLRYLPHLAALAPIPLYLAIEHLLGSSRIALAAFALAMFPTSTSLSFWKPRPARPPLPASHWLAVPHELFSTPRFELQTLWHTLEALAPRIVTRAPTVLVLPRWENDVFVFYVGEHFRVLPDVALGSPCEKQLAALGLQPSFSSSPPDVLVHFGREPVRPTREAHIIELTYPRFMPDGARPELTRHWPPDSQSTIISVQFIRTH